MTILTNAAGTLLANTTGQYLHLTWHEGERADDLVVELFEVILATMQRLEWRKVVVDQRRMSPASVETQIWFRREWLPRAASKLQSAQAAVILAQELFTQLDTVSLLRGTNLTIEGFRGLTYRLFRGEQQAVNWLLNDSELVLANIIY